MNKSTGRVQLRLVGAPEPLRSEALAALARLVPVLHDRAPSARRLVIVGHSRAPGDDGSLFIPRPAGVGWIWLDPATLGDGVANVLAHELAHAVIDSATGWSVERSTGDALATEYAAERVSHELLAAAALEDAAWTGPAWPGAIRWGDLLGDSLVRMRDQPGDPRWVNSSRNEALELARLAAYARGCADATGDPDAARDFRWIMEHPILAPLAPVMGPGAMSLRAGASSVEIAGLIRCSGKAIDAWHASLDQIALSAAGIPV